ncbi:MAG: PepSY-associated TM helix domain-containing protein [Verrucomicrobiota bacterium]
MDIETPAPARPHAPGYWRRHAAAWCRWLHIYLSMVSFAILLFFAVTGLTLNHAEWFTAGHATTRHCQGHLDPQWVKAPDAGVAKLDIVEFLRKAHGIKGALGEFLIDDSQCTVSFKGPGYAADSFIDRASGNYDLTESRLGLVAILNDLHKGRDSGASWSLLVDVSAVLMTAVSLTGLVLMFFFRRRRITGLAAAIAGALLCYLIYLALVP